MIQVVVKRDGRVVGYNEEKIKAAIRKAMLTTELGEDEALIQKIADRIGARGAERMTVEEIQDLNRSKIIADQSKKRNGNVAGMGLPRSAASITQKSSQKAFILPLLTACE